MLIPHQCLKFRAAVHHGGADDGGTEVAVEMIVALLVVDAELDKDARISELVPR